MEKSTRFLENCFFFFLNKDTKSLTKKRTFKLHNFTRYLFLTFHESQDLNERSTGQDKTPENE